MNKVYNNDSSMDKYAVITGDLVKSRKIIDTDKETVINSLKETFEKINKELLFKTASFEMFRGDSFQFILPKPELALLVSIIIRAHLRTYEPTLFSANRTKSDKPILYAYSDARIGIGIGSVSYNAKKLAESQGEAFINSGKAFDALLNNNERLAILTPWENMNDELEVQCKLADTIISRWTVTTAEAISHHLLYGSNQTELALKFGITQPAIHKRLTTYGTIGSIESFIKRFEKLIINAT